MPRGRPRSGTSSPSGLVAGSKSSWASRAGPSSLGLDGSPEVKRKMVPSRGRGWGRGRGKGVKRQRYEDDGEYSEKVDWGGASKTGTVSKRRARMGEGAYAENDYDALLRMQILNDFKKEESEEDEWPELKEEEVEDDLGETVGEGNRRRKREAAADEWEPRLEEEEPQYGVEDDEPQYDREDDEPFYGTEDEGPRVEMEDAEEDEEFTREDDSTNSSAHGSYATKSLDLGPKKLEVIMLDDDDDEPEEDDNDNAETETQLFNFNTFSNYNENVMRKQTGSDDADDADNTEDAQEADVQEAPAKVNATFTAEDAPEVDSEEVPEIDADVAPEIYAEEAPKEVDAEIGQENYTEESQVVYSSDAPYVEVEVSREVDKSNIPEAEAENDQEAESEQSSTLAVDEKPLYYTEEDKGNL